MAQHSFAKSLKIQIRVIGALLMREVLTRYGRHNLGFLWLFVEPLLFTVGIVILWSVTKLHSGSVNIIAFAITGYSYVLMWRNIGGRLAGAVQPNLALMYHRNVRIVDIYWSRILLEIAGITISFALLFVLFITLQLIAPPADVFLMVNAWLLLALFTAGLGFVIGIISEVSEVFDKIWHTFTYLFLPFSGAFFFVDTLPTHLQKYVLYVPPIHAIEMLRHGYFGNIVRTHEQPMYLFTVSIVLLLIGLIGVSWLNKKVIPE